MTIKGLKTAIAENEMKLKELLDDPSWKTCSFKKLEAMEQRELKLRELIEELENSLEEQLKEANIS